MKETLLAFAAMAFAVSFTACDSKTAPGTATADSTQQDSTEAMAETPKNVFDGENFSVTGPEGWEASESFYGVRFEDVNSKETFKPVITIGMDKKKTLAEKLEYDAKSRTKGADVTIGEYTFTTMRNESSGLYSGYAEVEGGVLILETAYFAPEEKLDVLKAVFETLKLK